MTDTLTAMAEAHECGYHRARMDGCDTHTSNKRAMAAALMKAAELALEQYGAIYGTPIANFLTTVAEQAP